MKLMHLFEFMPKSKFSASYGSDKGNYPFFTSSNTIDKYCDDFIYDGEFLIIGDGGTGNCKHYNGKFSVSDHNYVLKPKSQTNALAVKYFCIPNEPSGNSASTSGNLDFSIAVKDV